MKNDQKIYLSKNKNRPLKLLSSMQELERMAHIILHLGNKQNTYIFLYRVIVKLMIYNLFRERDKNRNRNSK